MAGTSNAGIIRVTFFYSFVQSAKLHPRKWVTFPIRSIHAKKPIILDFDSTLCAVESLDALASIVLTVDPDAQAKVAEIERLTNLGMSGELPLSESLARRLATLTFERAHIEQLVGILVIN